MHALVGAALVLFSPAAKAAVEVWDFSFFGAVDSGFGQLTTDDSLSPNFLITGITGFYDSNPITALIGPGGYLGNDNILFSGFPKLDFAGFSFSTASNNVNVYFNTNEGFGLAGNTYAIGFPGGPDEAISFSISAVPEPATWALMLIGFAGIGFFAFHRAKKTATLTA